MTIEAEPELGLFLATCDRCGEQVTLDDPEALEELGWRQDAPERVKFPTGLSTALRVDFPQDFCPDCLDDEPPRRVPLVTTPPAHRMPPRDPFLDNDPCDPWPRQAVWKLAGLRSDCGHPWGLPGDYSCGYCEAGRPYGR